MNVNMLVVVEGDFTMGDYWGIEKAHPEVKTK